MTRRTAMLEENAPWALRDVLADALADAARRNGAAKTLPEALDASVAVTADRLKFIASEHLHAAARETDERVRRAFMLPAALLEKT